MAIPATAVWEVRANAGNSGLQGGFYSSARSGTDYSQQDAAQLVVADIATDGAGTGISSATGGFTAAMAGNGIYITGGGTTAGWYELTAVATANNATIDRSAGASKTGATGRVGGATIFADAPLESCAAGNTVYVKGDGTHTLGAAVAIAASAVTAAVNVIGYNTAHGDSPTGTSRPLIAAGANAVQLGTGWHCAHLRFTGTNTSVLQLYGGAAYNCYVLNESGTAGRACCAQGSYIAQFIACEFSSTNGSGVTWSGASGMLVGCYVHDCAVAGALVTAGTVVRCIFDACGTGLKVYSASYRASVFGSVFYGCTVGVDLNGSTGNCVVGTIFNDCTTGATSADDEDGTQWFDYCDWHGNTADVSNVAKGPHDLAVDPQFSNAAGGNFTIGNAALKAAGVPGVMPGCVNTTNHEDIGLQQAAAAAAGTRAWASIG